MRGSSFHSIPFSPAVAARSEPGAGHRLRSGKSGRRVGISEARIQPRLAGATGQMLSTAGEVETSDEPLQDWLQHPSRPQPGAGRQTAGARAFALSRAQPPPQRLRAGNHPGALPGAQRGNVRAGRCRLLARLLLAIPAGGFLLRLFLIQHDCGHGAFWPSRSANDWTGRMLGVLTFTPYECWRRSHALHHAGTGNLDARGFGDVDTVTVDEFRSGPKGGSFSTASIAIRSFCWVSARPISSC